MSCPYQELPPSNWWDRAVAGRNMADIHPHLPTPLKISPETRIASGGSCFAQHISQALQARGYNYYVTESAPPALTLETARRYNYGVFSARYGNIYTTAQFLQLVQRAFGERDPVDQFWCDSEGRYFDLLRPRITPRGFASRDEAEADNRQHLAAVRRLFDTAEVFVFTLGLTESWRSKADGIVYPTCPGCGSAGEYDPARCEFHNMGAAETVESLSAAIERIRASNPEIEFILTVSPVPLIATMEARHVLQATTYSKSVLRVAAEEVVRTHAKVHYFASYEIIAATPHGHQFFEQDGRSLAPTGVMCAMDEFFRQFGSGPAADAQVSRPDPAAFGQGTPSQIVCDEEDFFRALVRRQ